MGPEQHGHMANVGYETYWRLLSDAVAEAKGEAPVKTLETSVDVPIKAYIPDKFIASKEQKIQIYRKIAGIEQQSDADDIITELCDRFGKVPEEVINLVDISLLRAAANRAGISFVNISEGLARIRFDQSFAPAPNLIINACNSFKGIASINTAGITLKVKKAYVRHMLTETINFIYSIKQ